MKNLFFLMASSIILLVCNCTNDKQNNFSYIKHFKKNERAFDTLVKYIEEKYIATDEGADLSRKIILLCNVKNGFKISDNSFCDSALEETMKELNIPVINIEKNVCFADKNFDLISFEVSCRDIENKTIYYHYSLCSDTSNESYENTSVKVIPLKKRWSVFIEKK